MACLEYGLTLLFDKMSIVHQKAPAYVCYPEHKEVLHMQAWECIQESIKWIEENLAGQIDIEHLARTAHLSPFYYQRLFSRLVGKPVMEYVKLRRLANAADKLTKHRRIIDVAMDCGFENHETFTRAFKDAYGITPDEYRNRPRSLSHFLMPELSIMYCVVDENVPLLADSVLLEVRREFLIAPRHFIGLSVQNPVDDTPGIDYLGELWDRLHQIQPDIPGLMPNGAEAGVSLPGEKEGFFTYFTGAQAMEAGEPNGFKSWVLQAGDYVACAFEAENFEVLVKEALNKARDYMLGVWLLNHRLEIEPFMAELYTDRSVNATMMEIWFKIK